MITFITTCFVLEDNAEVSEKKYRAQKYGKEWEKESWASSWLSMSKRVNGKAYCSPCDKDLVKWPWRDLGGIHRDRVAALGT